LVFIRFSKRKKRNNILCTDVFILFLSMVILSGCIGFQKSGKSTIRTKGIASWYGEKFHGRRTANGEIYNMFGLTAAHRTLPFGTRLEVVNLANGRSVTVRVNDRGPFIRGRFLDLSYGAAKRLGMVQSGISRVSIRSIHQPPSRTGGLGDGNYMVQVGSFRSKENAEDLQKRIMKWYKETTIIPFKLHGKEYFRVRVGSFETREEAYRVARKLREKEGISPLVTH